MTEESKQIVEFLNREPFKRNINYISFHSMGQEQFLQLLNDVFAEIDSRQGGDIREEASDSRAPRMLGFLKNMKYIPPNDVDVSTFRQGIVLGDKNIIQPILFYLLTNLDALKTRAYLAKYLVKLPVPDEILHDGTDNQIQDSWAKYTELQEQFSAFHRELKDLTKSSRGTAEVKLDISTMEDEKDNLQRKVERARKRVEGMKDFSESLQVAQRMRQEKERSEEIASKIQQQRRLLQSTEQRLQRTRQQVYEIQQTSGDSSTPAALVSRMEEDNQLNHYLVTDKLPKEIEAKRKAFRDLQRIANEPAMTGRDLEKIERQIADTNAQINKMVEKRMVKGNPAKDKLGLFRQQATILAHKKDTLAESVQQLRDEAQAVEKEVEEKRSALRELGGHVLKGDEYKKYVAKLRTKSNVYKKSRAELAEVRSETGILTRTEAILQKQNDQYKRRMNNLENKKGVAGFRETQDELEKVSAMKSELDEVKHRTLDDMSEMVQQLNSVIHEKKALLAPIIKEMRPLRHKCQELSVEYEEKKAHYDSVAAGLESNRVQLEQTVSTLREECFTHDSRYHYFQCMIKILQSKLDRANREMKAYKAGDKKNSVREVYNRRIQEQENLAKSLREQQKRVRQNQETDAKQGVMWRDLDRLMKCKLSMLEQQQRELKTGPHPSMGNSLLHRDSTEDRLIL